MINGPGGADRESNVQSNKRGRGLAYRVRTLDENLVLRRTL